MLAIPSANRWHEFRARYLYTVRAEDAVFTREEWRRSFLDHAGVASASELKELVGREVCVEILTKEDSYEVVWESGVEEVLEGERARMLVADAGAYADARFYPGLIFVLSG